MIATGGCCFLLRPPALGSWWLPLLLRPAALDGCLLLPLLRLSACGGLQLLLLLRPAALLGGLRQGRHDKVVAGGEQTLELATGALRDGPLSTLLGTLALAVAMGLLVGRRLADHNGTRRTL